MVWWPSGYYKELVPLQPMLYPFVRDDLRYILVLSLAQSQSMEMYRLQNFAVLKKNKKKSYFHHYTYISLAYYIYISFICSRLLEPSTLGHFFFDILVAPSFKNLSGFGRFFGFFKISFYVLLLIPNYLTRSGLAQTIICSPEKPEIGFKCSSCGPVDTIFRPTIGMSICCCRIGRRKITLTNTSIDYKII